MAEPESLPEPSVAPAASVVQPPPVAPSPAESPAVPAPDPYSPWQRSDAPTASAAPAPLPPLPPAPSIEQPEPVRGASRTTAVVEPAQVAALVGLTAALVGTLFPWLRISSGLRSQTASGWSGDAQYRFADWFALNAPLDALLVLVLAGVGIYLILGRLLGSNVPAIPYGVAGAGAAIALVGILNWIYIDSESTRVINPSLDIGFGVYLLILGGAVAAFAGYQDVRRDAAVRRTEFIDTP